MPHSTCAGSSPYTTHAAEPCSGIAPATATVPVQVYAVPTAPIPGGLHSAACGPAVVWNTATGSVPGTVPAGATPVRLKVKLPVGVIGPDSAPLA